MNVSVNPVNRHDSRRQPVDAQVLLARVRDIVIELHPHMRDRVHVTLDSALDRDLGLDSLARVELLVRLEQSFGVTLSEETLANVDTPRDVLRALLAASPGVSPMEVGPAEATVVTEVPVPTAAETLLEALEWHVRAHPDRAHVQIYGDGGALRTIAYRELLDGARAVAAGLREAGIEAGQSVALMLPTGVEYLHSFIGILLAGAVPVPVYPPARLSQIEDHFRRHARILENAGVVCLITFPPAKRVSRLLTSHVPGLRRVVTVAELGTAGLLLEASAATPDTVAFIQYTSGSTGNPKGVVLTHADILASLRSMGDALEARSSDVFVSWLPLYHDMGLIGAWLGSLVYGFPLVLMSPLTFLARPERWLQAIHKHRGTLSGGPNFAYELCLRRIDDAAIEGLDLSSWRLAFNGAEPVSAQTMEQFLARFARYGLRAEALAPVYGLAEATLGVAFTPVGRGLRAERVQRLPMTRDGRALSADADDEDALVFVSSGVPIPGFEVRIVDEGGRETAERSEGRLEFRGPSTTSGYYRNPQATRELFDGDWLDSGDRAFVADGEVYITGRSKDVIIRAGRNVYPYELEQAVGDIDGIRRGCVAAFGSSDPASGTERLVVVAETRETDDTARAALRTRIETLVTELLGMPADDVVVASPGTVLKTSSGKIRRVALREFYERGALAPRHRAVWLQIVRLALASLLPQARRWWRRLRSLAFAAYAWLVFGVLLAIAWPMVVFTPGLDRRWRWLGGLGRCLFALTGAGPTVQGAERLPADGKFIVVANHASYLDGLVLVSVLPRPVAFAAKSELRGNFFARVFLARLGCMFVERFDRARGAEDARQVIERLEQGASLAIFPEGTLHRMPGLLPFHLGAFLAAVQTGAPVVTLTLRGTRSILRDRSLFPRRGRIRVHVSERLLPETAGGGVRENAWNRALRLSAAVRAEMLRHCGEPDLADRRELSW
ncbi:MAG: AMP-binding protein [Gammaproteobacteria bacterium]|nr:AMP-binding protein [Gammaproteobacteria bacterium]NIM75031.1 AMP-binding protein [Gammaproteobacteria bacterium]NIN40081.1 AMP-binding protein [Gammaproteobacteria bacterium]NIO26568.1 AMP-binding protein [Gammaproteobacteria bacterium]NIO67120.1 AMP-binding protein [Gammaproteobacteria bacterium]